MKSSPTKIGLYGGSFDPIHNGHLILARDAMERLGLDKVVFVPASLSPHKLHREPANAEARVEIVRAAITGEPGFEIDTCEVDRGGPSFTIDTVRTYRDRFPQAQLYFFIGDDNLDELGSWKEISTLREEVQFVVLSRAGLPFLPEFPLITRRVEISSTEIRVRIARGQSVRYMVPVAACDVIDRLRLYRHG
jgi:nicotinate-nucleotide adenylyltransferase